MAARIENSGITKSTDELLRVFALVILAGAFNAYGAIFLTIVTYDSNGVTAGLMLLIDQLEFCLGLIFIVVAGVELFTGNKYDSDRLR